MDIIFDIGKVLIDFDYEEYVERIVGRECADEVVAATLANPDWIELDRGVLMIEDVLQKFMAKAPKYEREIRLVFAHLGECPKVKESTVPMIRELKARGHRVFFLSNYFEFLMHSAPWVLEFTKLMDGGIFSCFEKLVKPDAAIYDLLCKRYGISKDNCVFIDDSMKNVQGARDYGIRAILYTGQDTVQLFSEIGINDK